MDRVRAQLRAALTLLLSVQACAPGEAVRSAEAASSLASGAEGLDELGAALVAGLNARDGVALTALTVTQEEYTGPLFSALANHPAAEAMGRDLLWDMHERQSRDDMARAIEDHGGRGWRYLGLEPRGLTRRAGVLFHERPLLVVADARGEPRRLQVLASVVEDEATHRFKLLGFRDHP